MPSCTPETTRCKSPRSPSTTRARAFPFATSCRMRDNLTATRENSVAAKKPFSATNARTTAVDHISFEVEKGQIVGFVGPNGAGKTTTMRMLTCFLPPSAGTAIVAGFYVIEAPHEVKKRIGYLPEAPPLYLEMRTAEYLTFVGRLKGLSGAELRQRVDAVCDRCAVGDVKNKLLGKRSKGYRPRPLLPQATIHNPDLP